jgi:hypothetical protein
LKGIFLHLNEKKNKVELPVKKRKKKTETYFKGSKKMMNND